MLSPDDVTALLADRFTRNYPAWAAGAGTWPMRISLRPPGTRERDKDPVACHAWAAAWDGWKGPGHVERAAVRFATGTHRMPRALVLPGPRDAAAASPATRATWQRCGERLTMLERAFPGARFDRIIRRITELDAADFRRLDAAVTWLHANPASGYLLRQLPIEGVDTKWLMGHAGLVLPLLGDPGPGSDVPEDQDGTSLTSPRRRLHERLGLRVPPELVQVAVLDPALRACVAGGMRHFAASVEDLSAWAAQPRTVVILENKETGYAITGDHPGAVVFHGHGFHVQNYARIPWVRAAPAVIYWGDIDGPGLEFLSSLREYGVPARSVLTDTATLDAFGHLAVDGTPPGREPPCLDQAERSLHARLAAHAAAAGAGLLLEQERIPWNHAYPRLAEAMGSAPG